MSMSSGSSNTPNLHPTLTTPPPAEASKLPTPDVTALKPPKPAKVISSVTSAARLQQIKQAETEKQRNEEAALRKRAFADRFKNRGKRALPDEDAKKEEPTSSKKSKRDKELSQYEKEVKQYKGRSLKDDGVGVRPLVK